MQVGSIRLSAKDYRVVPKSIDQSIDHNFSGDTLPFFVPSKSADNNAVI